MHTAMQPALQESRGKLNMSVFTRKVGWNRLGEAHRGAMVNTLGVQVGGKCERRTGIIEPRDGMKREKAMQTETIVGGMARERQDGTKSCFHILCSSRLDQLPRAQVC